MILTTKKTGLMLATGLATLAMMQSASALEAQAFIDRFESVYARQRAGARSAACSRRDEARLGDRDVRIIGGVVAR